MGANLTPAEIAAKFAMVENIVSATVAKPTIVNEASKFVVVTYWWGRGRENFNTARPCGEFYESLLDKPTHLLSPVTATTEKYKTALLRNPKFMQFVDKKIHDYQGVVRAYKMQGKPLSRMYIEKTAQQLKVIILNQVLAYVESVLPQIQEYQHLFVERADLEDTFRQRLQRGLTAPAQLKTIGERLDELKLEKANVLKTIKGKIGPFKNALDRELRYVDPITYDQMIANWETSCANAGCNHLAVEYPPFAEPGGYQLAINAKPRFIQKALELCEGRGVLYIDGDMTVNRYPAIFDIPDVDMMARGWNVDPRSSYMHNQSIMVDPYTFETSGGTMFFGQTPEAHLLLRRWIENSEKCYQWGKADDRILSLVFNSYKLLLPLKIIQLPVEYLWLTLDYDDSIEPELMDPEFIFLEHPECLTSEETAAGQGASSSRTPKFYETIENTYPRSEQLYEAVMFPTQESTDVFRPYLNYLRNARYFEDAEDESLIDEPPFYVVPFAGGLGPFQSIAEANYAKAQAQSMSTNANRNEKAITIKENDANTIPRILNALMNGKKVRYIPITATPQYVSSLERTLQQFPRLEFAFVNSASDTRDIFYFQSEFNTQEPAFFAPCPQLIQLLSMCETLEDITKHFRNGYQFLSRIRTTFLKRFRVRKSLNTCRVMQGGQSEKIAEEAEDALVFLYGEPMQGGTRRKRRAARKTYRRKSRR